MTYWTKHTICIPFSLCYFCWVISRYKSNIVRGNKKIKGLVKPQSGPFSFAGAQLIDQVTSYKHSEPLWFYRTKGTEYWKKISKYVHQIINPKLWFTSSFTFQTHPVYLKSTLNAHKRSGNIISRNVSTEKKKSFPYSQKNKWLKQKWNKANSNIRHQILSIDYHDYQIQSMDN